MDEPALEEQAEYERMIPLASLNEPAPPIPRCKVAELLVELQRLRTEGLSSEILMGLEAELLKYG
jgi:hypothetical protein